MGHGITGLHIGEILQQIAADPIFCSDIDGLGREILAMIFGEEKLAEEFGFHLLLCRIRAYL